MISEKPAWVFMKFDNGLQGWNELLGREGVVREGHFGKLKPPVWIKEKVGNKTVRSSDDLSEKSLSRENILWSKSLWLK